MRLLFLALSFPLPANNGHKLRTSALLRALAEEGHQVSLLAFARHDELPPDTASLSAECHDVEVVPLIMANAVHSRDLLHRLARLVSPLPYGITRFDSPVMQAKIRARLQGDSFDAILCDVFTIVNVPQVSIPIIFNNENVEHVILERYRTLQTNPAKRAYVGIEARKMKRWERASWRRSMLALACSEADRKIVSALCPGVLTAVAPNVVDGDAYLPDGNGEVGRVLFQGAMDWFPNQDAARYFITEILPAITSRVSGVRFVVAGRNPSAALLRRFATASDVQFTGTVLDMRNELKRAAICVVPLRIGSGTRLKILEAAAMAKPIVTTRVGMEGLDFVDGEEILVADEPKAFADAVGSLLRDPSRRQALGQAARRRFDRQYTPGALRKALAEALMGLETAARTHV